MVYLITYDLHKIKDYPRLEEAINKLGDCTRPLYSFWLVNSALPIDQINIRIKAAVDDDDAYYITTINQVGRGSIVDSSWDWLNQKLNPLRNTLLKPVDLRKAPSSDRKIGFENLKRNPFPPKL